MIHRLCHDPWHDAAIAIDMNSKIFISYARKDYDAVIRLRDEIFRRTGVRPWMDLSGIETGTQFADVIAKAIDGCELLVFVISRHSVKSEWTEREVLYAQSAGKKIYPVVIDDVELTGKLKFLLINVDRADIRNDVEREKVFSDMVSFCASHGIDDSAAWRGGAMQERECVRSSRPHGSQSLAKTVGAIALLAVLAAGGYYGWRKYDEGVQERVAKVQAEKDAIEKRMRQREERLAKLQAEKEREEEEIRKREEERKQNQRRKKLAEEQVKREREKTASVKPYSIMKTQEVGKPTIPEHETRQRECRGPQHGDTKTLALPDGITMEMIYVGPGSFTMGSPVSENGRDGDEKQHLVTLTRGFWLGKYEVTQKQWVSVMGTNPSHWKGDNLPVEMVSWNDCNGFARKVNSLLNCGARLPSEAEWEYACRAGTTGAYAGDIASMGWYDENSGGKTHPVGQKQSNAWGFYDMHGNVGEWCDDWYGDYPSESVTNPTGSAYWSTRVLRGGGWSDFARFCRSASRYGDHPGSRGRNGFRLCCSEMP